MSDHEKLLGKIREAALSLSRLEAEIIAARAALDPESADDRRRLGRLDEELRRVLAARRAYDAAR